MSHPRTPEPEPTPPADTPMLSPDDAAALDAALQALPEASVAGNARDRRVGELLRVISASAVDVQSHADGEALVQRTLARVAEHRQAADQSHAVTEAVAATDEVSLCPADAEALDSVIAGINAEDDQRADRVRGVLQLLSAVGPTATHRIEDAAQGEQLVQRTVDAAADQRQRERFAQQIEMFAEPRRTLGVGWRQVLSAAAVFLIGISLLMPVIEHNRTEAQKVACATNLAIAGSQMNAYAADFGGVLPRGPIGDSWIKVGQPDAVDAAGRFQSNSAHLYLLIREGYVAPQRLACVANREATAGPAGMGQVDWASPNAVSYSYQNQYTPRPIRIDRSRPQLAVLADKNPLFIVRDNRVVFDVDALTDAPSTLHRGLGQNILTLDGGVHWSRTPRVGDDDNVWVIRGYTGRYTGNEAPTDAQRDSFLVP